MYSAKHEVKSIQGSQQAEGASIKRTCCPCQDVLGHNVHKQSLPPCTALEGQRARHKVEEKAELDQL